MVMGRPSDLPAGISTRVSGHSTRCDCAGCRREKTRYQEWWRSQEGQRRADEATTRAAGARAVELLDEAWTRGHLAHTWRMSRQAITNVIDGTVTRMNAANARRMLTLYPSPWDVPSGTTLVPNVLVTRRIRALQRQGWTAEAVRPYLTSSTWEVAYSMRPGKKIKQRTLAEFEQVYRKLEARRGPSEQTRQRAERLGYPSPAAWDDDQIDRVDGVPSL